MNPKCYYILTILVLISTLGVAQKIHRYPYSSGVIEYNLEGSTKGKQVTYWDEFGYREATVVSSETTLFGRTTSTKKTLVTIGDVIYEWTDEDNKLYKTVNPIAEVWQKGNFSDVDLKEFNQKYLEILGYEKTGEGVVLGRKCDIYDGLDLIWMWNGILLKSEVKILASKSKVIASKIKTNIPVSSFQFVLPITRELIDNSQIAKSMDELLLEPENTESSEVNNALKNLFKK